MPYIFEKFSTGGSVDKIQRWIELNNNSANYLFAFLSAAKNIDELIAGVDTSKVTDMTSMFNGCAALTSVPFFDTSNVTTMRSMFTDCNNLTSVPLFDTSKVTNMANIFYKCNVLTHIPFFDTSNVTTMSYSFASCQEITSLPLFDTSKVTIMGRMLWYCVRLTTVPAFDMRKVTDTASMFSDCKALTECWIRNIKTNLQVGSGTTYGHLLTLESLLSLCKECRNTGSLLKLTVGSANLEKLAGVYIKLIDITDEMRAEDDLIDEKSPFVQCESADEGAMRIEDYMATKKWQLA